jgi:F0F1-type ATP synthase gamma subunit
VVVTGRLGKRLYDASGVHKDYKYFEMSDTASNDEHLKNLLSYITNYNNVTVYHGVFKSILVQDPQKTTLTGEVLKAGGGGAKYDLSFIFEPSVETVAKYFEKQILSLIFEQSVFESGLSKFASRMVSLDNAAGNIMSKSLSMGFDLKKAKHKKTDSNIQENISGVALWV